MLKNSKFLITFITIVFISPLFVLAYSDGVLLRAADEPKVHIIYNNKKRWIRNINTFNSYNFQWKNVKIVSQNDLAKVEDGKLIRLRGDDKVYQVDENGTRVHIKSVAEFELLGLSWADVASVTKEELNDYREAPTVVVAQSPTPAPSVSISPVPSAKINSQLPFPDYIRADWLISHATANYGRISPKIIFKYSDKEKDRIENFRLYEKKPGDQYFSKVAEFEQVLSTGCSDIDVDGGWIMTDAGQCGYWIIQRTIPPGDRGVVAYLDATNYSEGEYGYYVVGVDKDGAETRPSLEAKLVFLTTANISSPADQKEIPNVFPVFQWSIADSWPKDALPDYYLMISDSQNSQNPLWLKQLRVMPNKPDQSFSYDGSGLDSTKRYRVYIYGHYRQSEFDPDYVSISRNIPEFWVKPSSFRVSLSGFLKAWILKPFTLLH